MFVRKIRETMENASEMEMVCACALNGIFGNEPKIAIGIINAFGNCREIFSLGRRELSEVLGPFSRYSASICRKTLDDFAGQLNRLKGLGCGFIPFTDPGFPPLLRECCDAPAGLYFKGDPTALQTASVSIVGTRDMSLYGKYWCERTVRTIESTGSPVAIVSGLALGIDATAHRSALECSSPTIAVLPTGIDDIYPYRHRPLAEQICGTKGCAIITDYPPGTKPMAFTFVRRNRIIAGMSESTILIESKARGGGMITARLACSYGRSLFVLPGRIDDPRSAGCNLLLREKLADPITEMHTLPSRLGLGFGQAGASQDSLENELRARYSSDRGFDRRQAGLLVSAARLIRDNRGITVSETGEKLGIGYEEASVLTGLLETDGIIGKDLFQRCCIHSKFKSLV